MASIAAKAFLVVEKSVPFGAGRAAGARKQSGRSSPLIALFFFALGMPIIFYLGSVRLSPYRLVLIATFIPCLFAWLFGSVGRIRLPDIFILMAAIWGAIVLVHVHGVEAGLQPAGIFVIETLGSFLLARRYIRDVFAFQRMVRWLVVMVLVLLPFAVYENVTGSPILIQLFGQIFDVHAIAPKQPRLGLARAQAIFEHPILFGVVCSSAFALSYYVMGARTRLAGRFITGLVAITVFTSLSAGALLSVAVQSILIGWDKLTVRVVRRWVILGAITIAAYIVVETVSNRSAFEVFISYLTFNADQSYMRIHIWHYGTESVIRHPIFGIGLNEWERPEWLPGSIDNFWLNTAVTYGVTGLFFLGGAFFSVCFGLARLRNLSFQIAEFRKGLVISLCGIAVAICTVHLWNASYVLFIFLLGSGMWMFEVRHGVSAGRPTERSLIQARSFGKGGCKID